MGLFDFFTEIRYPSSFELRSGNTRTSISSFKVTYYNKGILSTRMSYEISGTVFGSNSLSLTVLCCDKKGVLLGTFFISERVADGMMFKFCTNGVNIPENTKEIRFRIN